MPSLQKFSVFEKNSNRMLWDYNPKISTPTIHFLVIGSARAAYLLPLWLHRNMLPGPPGTARKRSPASLPTTGNPLSTGLPPGNTPP